jgi:predicted ATPase
LAAVLPMEFSFIDLGSHLLKGVEGTEKLFQVAHPSLPARDFPPPNTLSFVRHNIPKSLTSFVGRRTQLDELTTRIIKGTRQPIRIGGAPGIGKTRLLQQLAIEIAGDFTDGAWYVNLAAAAETSETIASACAAFSLRPEPSRTPLEQLYACLGNKDLLLILDHAATLPNEVTELLARDNEIQGIICGNDASPADDAADGYVVGPMGLPDRDELDAVAASESGRLFADRAKDATPTFELSGENCVDVAQVLRKLNGIPQLIELGAARMRAMSPKQLLERLDRGMDLLTNRSAGTLELKMKPSIKT